MLIHRYIKKTIVYTLLCIYGFALLKPVMPVANDIIAHTFYKMQHLATVHFENGKYHVHQELAAGESQQKDSRGTSPSSIYESLANHLSAATETFNTIVTSSNSKIILPPIKHPLDAFLQHSTPPPEA